MARVSIRYQNGTTVEANNLGDALFHIAHTGTDYVADIVEQDSLARVQCEACKGAGVVAQEPVVVLSAEGIGVMVAEVNAQAPARGDIEDRVDAAHAVAELPARAAYVAGDIEIDELERQVASALATDENKEA